ncbi:hypothetical protein [Daejeonella sp.]|uniref:hypothetical protein n=1 Tax=Daejeonella sp. TaxID=2805397 RepID=UPI0037843BAC
MYNYLFARSLLFLASFLLSCNILLANMQTDSVIVYAKVRSKQDNQISFSDWRSFPTRTVASLSSKLSNQKSITNKYGSQQNIKTKSTGFFRTEKINGKWWSIDPDGFAGLHIAVNSIQQGKSDRNIKAFKTVFGNDFSWIKATLDTLSSRGFNGAGSWSDTDAIIAYNKSSKKPIAYSVMLNMMSEYGNKRGGTYQEAGHKGYPKNTIFVFDPEFEVFCDQFAQKIVKYRNDQNLYGYFTDNELPFSLKNLESYLSLPQTDLGFQAAKKWLSSRNVEPQNISDQDRADFLGYIADKYFATVSASIKKYDPNHMILGSRFYTGEKNVQQFMESAGKYIDVVSVNYYGTWTPSQQSMKNWEKWSGKPLIITEFYVKAEDSGLPNQSGAGWVVKTQNDRGLFYQNYCLSLLESKSCIGWHWFKFQDNDPKYTKADPSNNDANKGIVNNDYQFYSPLLKSFKDLNINSYLILEYFNKNNDVKQK